MSQRLLSTDSSLESNPRKKLMMEQENGELAANLQSELDDVRSGSSKW